MKTIFDHIDHVKGKPHHVRKRVAFTAAACGSGLVALVWFVGSVSFGAFAIKPNSFADSTGREPVIMVDRTGVRENLAGAGAALPSADAPAHIEIVDTTSSTSMKKQAEQTTIPF